MSRTFNTPYPNIFLEPRGPAFPFRCPLCFSENYGNIQQLAHEQQTFAVYPALINPADDAYVYQEYWTLICHDCSYRYHFRPRGKWYKTSWISEPRRRITERVANVPVEIGKLQDYRILELAPQKRYSSYELNPAITNSQIALLTGAGFSVPLGFPIASGFKETLSPKVLDTFRQWLCPTYSLMRDIVMDEYLRDLAQGSGASAIQAMYEGMHRRRAHYERVINDVETFLDHLFRIQRIALLIPDRRTFATYLGNLRAHVESIFVFNERFTSRGWYPTTSQLQVHPDHLANTTSTHFNLVRDMIFETIPTILFRCSRPSVEGLQSGLALYKPLLDSLTILNRGVLPMFTTNYDLAVEEIFRATGEEQRLVTGAECVDRTAFAFKIRLPSGNTMPTTTTTYPVSVVTHRPFLRCTSQSIALFHLHGCSTWFVDVNAERTLQCDSREQDLELFLRMPWLTTNGLLPGAIFPATVKDAYTLSPPFDMGYDYLSQVVLHTRVILIIGFSGRDETIKEVLFWGARQNTKLQFIIVGHGDAPPPHLMDVLPADRVHYLSGGISGQATAVVQWCHSVLQSEA